MSAPEIREAIEKITKVLSEQPQKARSKNSIATATLETGLRFQVTGRSERRSCFHRHAASAGWQRLCT